MGSLVVVDFHVKPESLNDMKATLRAFLPDTRTSEGCISLTAHINEEDANHLILVEHWESSDHYRKHRKRRAEQGDLAQIDTMLVKPSSIRYFDIIDV